MPTKHLTLGDDEKLFARFYKRSDRVWLRRGKRINNGYRDFFEVEAVPMGAHDFRVLIPATADGGTQSIVFARSHMPLAQGNKALIPQRWAPPTTYDEWDAYKAAAVGGSTVRVLQTVDAVKKRKNQPKTLAEMLEEEA